MARKSRRRGNGEGTIRERTVKRKDGTTYKRWFAVATAGSDPSTGKQRRLEGPWRATWEEARDDLKDIIRQLDEGNTADALTMSVEEYMVWWLEQHEQSISSRTFSGYQRDIDRFITPNIGRHRLAELSPVVLQRWQTKLIRDHSPFIAKNARACLSAALTQAVRWQMLPFSPLAAVAPVKLPPRSYKVWTPAEVRAFLEVTEPGEDHAMFLVLLSLGLRLGELVALRWADIRGTSIHIRHAIEVDVSLSNPEFGPPKYGSVRWLPLDDDVLAALEKHRATQVGLHNPHGLIFATSQGGAYSRKRVYESLEAHRKLAKVIEGEAVRPPTKIRIHDLRHTAASLWIRAGMDVVTVASRLGHRDKNVTLRTYAHEFQLQTEQDRITLRNLLQRVEKVAVDTS